MRHASGAASWKRFVSRILALEKLCVSRILALKEGWEGMRYETNQNMRRNICQERKGEGEPIGVHGMLPGNSSLTVKQNTEKACALGMASGAGCLITEWPLLPPVSACLLFGQDFASAPSLGCTAARCQHPLSPSPQGAANAAADLPRPRISDEPSDLPNKSLVGWTPFPAPRWIDSKSPLP